MTSHGFGNIVHATYRVRPGEELAFERLLKKHRPALEKAGLIADRPTVVYKGGDERGPVYVEVFEWIDAQGSRRAHEDPYVGPIWAAMGDLVEERDGRPKFEFPHFEELEL